MCVRNGIIERLQSTENGPSGLGTQIFIGWKYQRELEKMYKEKIFSSSTKSYTMINTVKRLELPGLHKTSTQCQKCPTKEKERWAKILSHVRAS